MPNSKALTLESTINPVDRRDGAYEEEDLEDVLVRARKLLANINFLLTIQSQRLAADHGSEPDKKRQDELFVLLRQVQKNMTMVLDLELRTGASRNDKAAMNLEEARAEILGRLSRLAN